jgi:spermidine synthase
MTRATEPHEDAPPASEVPGALGPRRDRRLAVLLGSIFVIATNGVIYELLIAGYSSYLLGDSVTQFALTIGVFLCAMGLGSYVTRFIARRIVDAFVWTEVAIALCGGPALLLLYVAYQLELPYVAAMLGTTGVIGALIGLEIPLVIRLAAGRATLRRAVADVLGLDYVGALLGSLIFPLVLLPSLGFTRTCLAVGLVNLAVAGTTLAAFRRELRRWGWLAAVAAAVGAALATAMALAPWIVAELERE